MSERKGAPRPNSGSTDPAPPFGTPYAGGDAWRSGAKGAYRPPEGDYPYPVEQLQQASGTSIFDPVLCELVYRWFCPPGGTVLDPFAGGSVRGIVAAKLGRAYHGIDLRPEQVAANVAQWAAMSPKALGGELAPVPQWVVGDSRTAEVVPCDLIFTCPPYADLERYSDDPRDLSTMPYPEFLAAYRGVIARAVAQLRTDRYAAIVVGDVRGPDGYYYGFPADTVEAFEAAGARLYNDAVLVTAVGSLPIRAGRQFAAGRKLGKTHQNLLVFCKGDPRKAADACGQIEAVEITAADDKALYTEAIDGLAKEAVLVGPTAPADNTPELTPIEWIEAAQLWCKRDDTYALAGVAGGKVRTCWHLAQGAVGLVTAGSRQSPQVNIVAHLAQRLGIPCRVHVPSGPLTPELLAAQAAGAEVVQHKPGHNSVIVARARVDAAERNWREVPFGMECSEAPRQTATQVRELPAGVQRIVVPVGSGMSLAGVLWGLQQQGIALPVLAVAVGADPTKRLDRYAPQGWRARCELVTSTQDYHDHAPVTQLGHVALDPVYEAKCLPYLKPGDLLWCVGIRQTATR